MSLSDEEKYDELPGDQDSDKSGEKKIEDGKKKPKKKNIHI